MILYTDKHRVPFEVDEEDYEAVSRYSWYVDSQGYPSTNVQVGSGRASRRPLRLHAFLMGPAPDGLEWDHENRDKLDNCRTNLRAVTHGINLDNTGTWRNNTSGVRGVSRHISGLWRVRRGKKHYGFFKTFEEAAEARSAIQ